MAAAAGMGAVEAEAEAEAVMAAVVAAATGVVDDCTSWARFGIRPPWIAVAA